MSTKQILIILTISILAVSTSIYFVLKSKTVIQTPNTVSLSPTPTVAPLLTWADEAGFSFQYPEGTTIDKHPEDNVNYANLTLTFPDKTTAQVTMSDKTAINIKSATFTDNDVVVTITGNSDLIIKSWQFIYPTPTTSKTTKINTSSNDSEDVLEEE